MTKALKTLIKLNKNKLDKILKDIEFQETEKNRVISKKLHIENEVRLEIDKYSNTEYSFMLQKYIENSDRIIKSLNAQIQRLNEIIQKLRLSLRDQYSELKKFEIALEKKLQLEFEKEKKLETKKLDEFGINQYLNKK